MRGFMGWLRRQPEFKDLANDATGCGTLKALMVEMSACSADPRAWRMLFDAIYAYPGELVPGWHRDAFRSCVSVDALAYVVMDYVHGETPGLEAMPDDVFNAMLEPVRILWRIDPHGAEQVIDAQYCSSMQYCLLWGLQP